MPIPRELAVVLGRRRMALGETYPDSFVLATGTGRPLPQRNVARALREAQKRAVDGDGRPVYPILHEVDDDGQAVLPRAAFCRLRTVPPPQRRKNRRYDRGGAARSCERQVRAARTGRGCPYPASYVVWHSSFVLVVAEYHAAALIRVARAALGRSAVRQTMCAREGHSRKAFHDRSRFNCSVTGVSPASADR